MKVVYVIGRGLYSYTYVVLHVYEYSYVYFVSDCTLIDKSRLKHDEIVICNFVFVDQAISFFSFSCNVEQ